MPHLLDPVLADALAAGITILTPNQRAARAIRKAFDQSQLAAGLTRWTPPEVYPLDVWLAQLWHARIVAGKETRTLLNPAQQHVLWRQEIAADPEVPGLRSLDALAQMAAHAWSLLNLYEGRERLRPAAVSSDARAFERWSHTFARRLERDSLITPAQLPRELTRVQGLSVAPLALVDFDTHTPAMQTMLEVLQSRGVSVQSFSTSSSPSTSQLVVAGDDADELRTAALWIREQLAVRAYLSIAVVVPDLAQRRASIERVFAPVLSPEQLPITSAPASPAFEFSLGRSLSIVPIISTALDLLAWTHAPLSVDRISALLLSPVFSSEDLSAVAEFDAFELRRLHLLRPELTLEATSKLAQGCRLSLRLAHLIQQLRALHQAAQSEYLTPQQSLTLRQPLAQWSESFRVVLHASGWTRHAVSTSSNFQAHRRFEGALDELATLDAIQASSAEQLADVRTALVEFSRILDQAIFAPESQNTPVQIIGPLELGGVVFDALWFLGADDLAWPLTPATSPLLSRQLQRSLLMPGADPSRDESLALALTRRIAASASSQIIFSYAQIAAEGERRPSALLAELSLQQLFPDVSNNLPEPLQFVAAPDATDLLPLPSSEVRGGARVLKLQAACAFRAFAEHRLWSTSPGTSEVGLDRLEQGDLVHRVMQFFWTEVQSQHALRAFTSAQRREHLEAAISTALTESRILAVTAWEVAYLSVHRQRLYNLLAPWLYYELQRASFSVRDREEKKHFQLGPLTFGLRIDRIDSTDFGDLIIDYKTGDAKTSQWDGDRPDEPQLPLYAVLAQAEKRPLAGVAFALLRPGKDLCMRGYTDAPSILSPTQKKPKDKQILHEEVDRWREVLTRLAQAFADGDTAVLPKDYPRTCKNCGQRILCRLDPAKVLSHDDDMYENVEQLEDELAIG